MTLIAEKQGFTGQTARISQLLGALGLGSDTHGASGILVEIQNQVRMIEWLQARKNVARPIKPGLIELFLSCHERKLISFQKNLSGDYTSPSGCIGIVISWLLGSGPLIIGHSG